MVSKEMVLVTGAGGAVGVQIVRQLLKKGYRVKVTDLPGTELPFAGPRVRRLAGDLRDADFVRELPFGVHHIIHAAGLSRESASTESLHLVNTEAPRLLWERAADLGIETFVYFSTGSLYASDGGPHRETDPLDPVGTYEQTKYRGEKVLLRGQCMGGGPRLVILRPALILGPRGVTLASRLATIPLILKELAGFCPRFVRGPDTSVVHVLDVAAAAVHLMKAGVDGLAYNLATSNSIPLGDFITLVARHLELPVLPLPRIPLPGAKVLDILNPLLFRPELFWSADTIGETAWRRIRERHDLQGQLAPLMDRATLTYAIRGLLFDNSRLLEAGFRLTFPRVEDTIRDAIHWYRDNNWLP